jgi:hypothetical protein
MADHFEGECVGGPLHRKRLHSHTETLEITQHADPFEHDGPVANIAGTYHHEGDKFNWRGAKEPALKPVPIPAVEVVKPIEPVLPKPSKPVPIINDGAQKATP